MEDSYLFYIEGVNISNVIYDTSQLSVRRGGSQLLRYTPKWINQHFNQKNQTVNNWQMLADGASRGLFFFQSSLPKKEIEKAINDLLTGKALFNGINDKEKKFTKGIKHCTFIKKIISLKQASSLLSASVGSSISNNPLEWKQTTYTQLEKLIRALCATQQFKQATLSLPHINAQSNTKHLPCAWDNLRPVAGTTTVERDDGAKNQAKVSESSFERHNFGRKLKKQLIPELIGEQRLNSNITTPITEMAGDLQKMTSSHFINEQGKAEKLVSLGFTAGKMAVLYVDGNGFGKLFNECKSVRELQQVNEQLAQQRLQFLCALIEDLSQSPYGYVVSSRGKERKKQLRLEILLWGGDEITVVVPAWYGLRAAELFYQHAQAQPITFESGEQKTFSYAGGVVFCQVKTPISRIEAVAKDLADTVKQQENQNGFGYAIFESVDFPKMPIDEFIEHQFALSKHSANRFFLSATCFNAISGRGTAEQQSESFRSKSKKLINYIEEQTLASRQLYRLVEEVHHIKQQYKSENERHKAYKAARKPLKDLMGEPMLGFIQSDLQNLFIPLLPSHSSPSSSNDSTNSTSTQETQVSNDDYHHSNTLPWVHLLELKDYLTAYLQVCEQNERATGGVASC